jgi:hypothetical protein
MYRNTTVGSLPLGLSRRLLAHCFATLFACLMVVCGLALAGGSPLHAQNASGGGISGSITDPDGKVVVKAKVTATNTDTGVATTQETTSAGIYSIAPLPVGTYNVEVVAKGFQRLLQENIDVDNASMHGLNLKLTVGGENTTITVTDAPPYMNTTDATLGGTIENQLYSQLPLSMNGGPRDPTAFQYLMPGVQENPGNNTNAGTTAGSSGIYGGTGQANLNATYVEGMPVSNVEAQGSSTAVANAVSVDAVNQFSVQTSGASTSFGGAGVTNYTIQSGGNQFHGTVFDFIRNTMFDTWGYFSKVPAASGSAEKPGEHQNSYGVSVGGPILKDKLFFFGSYEGYQFTNISNTPQYITIPTMNNRAGNFTDVLGTVTSYIVDPTSGSSISSRQPYQGLLNGVPTFNVMNASQISSISNAMQSALPTPTNLSTFNNYLAVLPQANKDYTVDVKLDYKINSRNNFTLVGLGGLVGYGGAPAYSGSAAYSQLPVPYASGSYTNSKTSTGILKYTYVASQSLINSLGYSFTRNWGEQFSLTNGKTNSLMPASACADATIKGNENSCALGINNLPTGNAENSMPNVSFDAGNGPTAPSNWGSTSGSHNSSSGPKGTNTYTVSDQLTWLKNRHNFSFGLQVQWLETNGGTFGGYSEALNLTYEAYSTENCVPSSVVTCTSKADGDTYTAFLAGAVYTGSAVVQSIQDVGARYRPITPYVEDKWMVSPKLTLTLGLRYDYLQPYHEVHDRIAFLNSNMINPIVGVPGVLEYAGFPDPSQFTATSTMSAAQEFANYSPYMCHCTTPVHPYNKNIQPRVGFNYAINQSTTISGAFGLSVTHSGGVGGGSGATQATGNNSEFQSSTTWNGIGSTTGVPAFFLFPGYSNSPSNVAYAPPVQGSQPILISGYGPTIACVTNGTCSAYSAVPPWLVPGVQANPLQSTGNYTYISVNADHLNDYGCSTSDNRSCNSQGVNFADPYYGGRGPQFITYNLQLQKMINKKAVLTLAYSGTQTHFLPGGSGRGYAQNTFSPDYVQEYKNNLVGGCSTGCTPPYPLFSGTNATLAQSLRPFPQFSACATADMAKSGAGCGGDLWGNTGNANYNSFQLMVTQRSWHNLQGFMDYTRSKQIDNTGYHRTQFPVGPQDGNFVQNMSANRVDRSLSTANQTNAFNLAWSYSLPIGRGQAFFATNRIAGLVGGGWEINGTYRYRDGYPLSITAPNSCMDNSVGGQGACMPDYVPGFDKRQARINGRWGRGPGANASNLNSIQYLNPLAFEWPDSSTYNTTYSGGSTSEPNTSYKIGNVGRTAPFGLTGPGWWDVDLGIRRTFNVRETTRLHLTFQVEADVTNATNSTFFNLSSSQWNNSAYGYISGQNQQIKPRDWQFAGRFRF